MEVYYTGLIIIGALLVFIGIPVATLCYCRKQYTIIE